MEYGARTRMYSSAKSPLGFAWEGAAAAVFAPAASAPFDVERTSFLGLSAGLARFSAGTPASFTPLPLFRACQAHKPGQWAQQLMPQRPH